MKALETYKRIVRTRIFNPRYTGVDAQDIITQVSKILYGDMNCSRCFECD